MVVFKKFLTLSCCCCRLILVAASMFLTRIYKMAREREELLLQLVSFRPTHLRRVIFFRRILIFFGEKTHVAKKNWGVRGGKTRAFQSLENSCHK